MELLSLEFWTTLLSIVVIDLVLAGDNAIVIGLAARNLPKQDQKKVIIFGTIGAVIIRALATLGVVWLLKIPFLLVIGGVVLIWIAIKLMVEEKEHNVEAGGSFWAAVRTIIIADAAMGLDNVLAVAGAANGHGLLVLLGLAISVPIVVWGSTIVLKFIERFPTIIVIGSAVLAWTSAKMFVGEFMKFDMLAPYFSNPVIKYGFEIVLVIAVVAAGLSIKRSQQAKKAKQAASHVHKRAQGE
ncbi:TerC family protein [Paenibacillus alvei]|uniref:TerC family protein n=1 Tax=Paenibacillus alvei TaxID=44250 RepID=A0AAP6ZUX8_PAEAL|nr:TerC family protein [Paenibacillus alvei]MBG9733717.1 membrane protein [Paenibacillus alvei]MBG9745740.1 membrane protein [Paenibacillus alvei]MCY9580430.1 TerC family protein [Paenibacillus alvei]MCY9583244.1 TerC family protein [Paenibacillus alvei]NOJ69209.1 TerC family protein [Paenibacillus alvei]